MVQWLRVHASNAGGLGSIPDQGTQIPHATAKSVHDATKTWHNRIHK